MPEGKCRLCLEVKDLRDSHYMPSALYPDGGISSSRHRQRRGRPTSISHNTYSAMNVNNGSADTVNLTSLVPSLPRA